MKKLALLALVVSSIFGASVYAEMGSMSHFSMTTWECFSKPLNHNKTYRGHDVSQRMAQSRALEACYKKHKNCELLSCRRVF